MFFNKNIHKQINILEIVKIKGDYD